MPLKSYAVIFIFADNFIIIKQLDISAYC